MRSVSSNRTVRRTVAGRLATFNVAIRTAVIDKSSSVVEFGAGGGVTWGSQSDLS